MNTDRPLLGIALMLGFCILAPLGDALAKLLGTALPLAQIVAIRFAVQALILVPLVWATGRMWRMQGRTLALAFLRTIVHIIGILSMFTSLTFLPLADAIAIVFVMPFFMLVLGKLVLNEEVGHRRLIACIVGFVGTMLVVQPSFAEVGWPALLPVFVAANFSVFMLLTRQIARQTDPIGLQAVSGVMAVAVMAPLLWLGDVADLPLLGMAWPNVWEWSLLAAIGTLGTGAHLLMTWSLRFAPASTLAPMQYLEIPFATFIGWLIFRELPNGLAALGICITIAAGLYVILRERATARSLASRVKPPPA